MQLQILEPQDYISGAVYCTLGLVAAAALLCIWRLPNNTNLDKIPTVGSNTWLGSWWDAIRHLINAGDDIQKGYNKYKGTPFKISTFGRWMIILSGRQHVEEVCGFRDDELSFGEAIGDILKLGWTFGHDIRYNPYIISVIRSRLSHNLDSMFADMKDEITTAFDDVLDLDGHEWESLPAFSTIKKVLIRNSNRVLVGLPLCHDPKWLDLVARFTLDVLKVAGILSFLPDFMGPFVIRCMTNVRGTVRCAAQHISSIVEGRREHVEDYSTSWADSPNDIFAWFMEGPGGSQHTVEDLAVRILGVNLVATHTSTTSFTQVLYHLAANPQYIQPLREEVESIVQEEGWSRAAVEKMHKIDSFVKESLRMGGTAAVGLFRKSLKEVTLSDGTVIPKGMHVAMAAQAMHQDNEFYEDPGTFDPFRFAKLRTGDSDDVRFRFSTTSPEYMLFEHGRHACPGRYFVASMVNTMLAHLVVTYDVKLEDNATFPRHWQIGLWIMANPTARVVFRRRAT